MKNKLKKLLNPGIEIIKNNRLVVGIILISILSIYFFGIRPSQIRKECSTTVKYSNSYQYINPEYSEAMERQKQRMLVDYIQCRNDNLTSGDQIYINKKGNNPYTPTQEQYNTLPIDGLIRYIEFMSSINNEPSPSLYIYTLDGLEKLNQYTLGEMSPDLYHVYDGYIIDIPTYKDLKENRSKYPQCSFPSDFVEKKLRVGGGEYTTDATDTEYKSCLRKNGLEDDKKPTSKEIQKNKTLCYKWYGKECDNPNFNPE